MIIRSKKNVLVDELSEYLNNMVKINDQKHYEEDELFEKKISAFISSNFTVLSQDKLKEYIEMVNKLDLLTEEKFKIINYKPKNQLELNLILPRAEEKLKKKDMDNLFKFILNN